MKNRCGSTGSTEGVCVMYGTVGLSSGLRRC
jgi:hypothetical protein